MISLHDLGLHGVTIFGTGFYLQGLFGCSLFIGFLYLRKWKQALASIISAVIGLLGWWIADAQILFIIYKEIHIEFYYRMGKHPVWMYSLFMVCMLVMNIHLGWIFLNTLLNMVTANSVKLCADDMNYGVCFYKEDGQVIFLNQKMNSLCKSITGNSLRNGNVFVKSLSGEMAEVDGRFWMFLKQDRLLEGEEITELLASDITEMVLKSEELRKDTEELGRMNQSLKTYSLLIDDVIREQEILQAKVNIHDEMNRLMLLTMSTEGDEEEKLNELLELWQRNAFLLCMESDRDARKQEEDLNQYSKALGVDLVWDGILPEALTESQKTLFFMAGEEAIANSVKHAKASRLEIQFTEREDGRICCNITNNGEVKAKEISLTGGLRNLQLLAKERNVEVSVSADKVFTLSLLFTIINKGKEE